jgi:hypothetical protein
VAVGRSDQRSCRVRDARCTLIILPDASRSPQPAAGGPFLWGAARTKASQRTFYTPWAPRWTVQRFRAHYHSRFPTSGPFHRGGRRAASARRFERQRSQRAKGDSLAATSARCCYRATPQAWDVGVGGTPQTTAGAFDGCGNRRSVGKFHGPPACPRGRGNIPTLPRRPARASVIAERRPNAAQDYCEMAIGPERCLRSRICPLLGSRRRRSWDRQVPSSGLLWWLRMTCLKLPRFCGHPTVWVFGVHNGKEAPTLRAGIPPADD